MASLFTLPPGVVDLEICQFLDAASLARLSCVNRELHVEIDGSRHWATLVTRSFGITANKVEMTAEESGSSALLSLSPPPQSRVRKRSPSSSDIKWRDIFLAASMDSFALASTRRDDDVLQVYECHPRVLLNRPETTIRDEIVLIHGLRRFPSSASLLRLYAQVIRRELGVRVVS
ncbi:hypothetical protein PybrP1_008271 [[Pythium] brassicae (nom. inval.)]|nr:hypothetical protein PybrP1_008271 [[Pythium] brassicae (nom. inval.)]